MKTMKVMFCTAVLASVALLNLQQINAADVEGPRAKIGFDHEMNNDENSITGGSWNTNRSFASIIAAGMANTIHTNTESCTIQGGNHNQIRKDSATAVISGGIGNIIGEDCDSSVI
jgi:hypothetical protein